MTDPSGRNPYRPGVGTKPRYLAGRERQIRTFASILRAAPELPANVRVTGLRGVGKTVLLGEYETVAENEGWLPIALELTPSANSETTLLKTLIDAVDRVRTRVSIGERIRDAVGSAMRAVKGLSITYQDVKVSLDPTLSDAGQDLARSLFDCVDAAVGQGWLGIVLLLDEAQVVRDDKGRTGEHPLSILLSTVAILQRQEVPLGLVLCGLPTLTGNLLHARSYTERMFRGQEVDSLGPVPAREAFLKPLADTNVVAADDLVEQVISEVEGYPYFIQLWGAELWDAATAIRVGTLDSELLAQTVEGIYERLDLDFYEPRVTTLTPAEQDVLLGSAMCSYPPLITVELNDHVDKSSGNINVLLGRLVQAGVIYRVRKGQYLYTAPKFRDFLLRRTGLTQ